MHISNWDRESPTSGVWGQMVSPRQKSVHSKCKKHGCLPSLYGRRHTTASTSKILTIVSPWRCTRRQGRSVPWSPLALPLGGLHAQALFMECQWMGASRLSMQNSCDIRIQKFGQMSDSIAPGVEARSIGLVVVLCAPNGWLARPGPHPDVPMDGC